MSMSEAEFASIMSDEKRIIGNITWGDDSDHSPARSFRAEVETDEGWPLFVQGRYNRRARKLSYSLILRTAGRIYGLDMGKNHGTAGEKHKHRNREVYAPDDITALYDDPATVWEQFCREAHIEHKGQMYSPTGSREMF